MQKGNIGVTTENIFPVIKKFLYSDHDIYNLTIYYLYFIFVMGEEAKKMPAISMTDILSVLSLSISF